MSVHAVHVIHKHWKFSVNLHDLYMHVIRLKKENYAVYCILCICIYIYIDIC